MTLLKYLPNFLTCMNLLSGSIAVVFAFDGKLHIAAILIIISAVFDFLDGLAARLFKAYSDIGKQLDSLADLVSFGLAPAVIVYLFMVPAAPVWGPVLMEKNILPFSAFLITIFSALRLAIFNIDERQSDSFIGLPTPANALFFISFPLILAYADKDSLFYLVFEQLVSSFNFLFLVTVLFSMLLVSNLKLFSLKFINYDFGSNRIRYIFVVLVIAMLLIFGFLALPFIIISYIVLSVINNSTGVKRV